MLYKQFLLTLHGDLRVRIRINLFHSRCLMLTSFPSAEMQNVPTHLWQHLQIEAIPDEWCETAVSINNLRTLTYQRPPVPCSRLDPDKQAADEGIALTWTVWKLWWCWKSNQET